MTRGAHFWIVATLGASLWLAGGCVSFPFLSGGAERAEKDLAWKHSLRVSQFVFHSDTELARTQPLFQELGTLREQAFKDLQLPPSSTLVQVHLFPDRERYEAHMKSRYPDLPKRRAFFVAQPRRLGGGEDLLVYTAWGDRVQQDLRHELTHALLHCVLKDVPLWLDEGLAEFYEMPPAWKGVNYLHLETLRQPGTTFDLARLETLTDVNQMTPAEYREAWAWTHLMLRSTPAARQTLLGYLQELRTNPRPGLLKPRLERAIPNLDDALRRHLASLDVAPAPRR